MSKDDFVKNFTKAAIDEAKVIECGFKGLMLASFPAGCPADQAEELRNFFFAGAQHLFSAIINTLDEDREPTAAEVGRLDRIADELEAFIQVFELKFLPSKGSA